MADEPIPQAQLPVEPPAPADAPPPANATPSSAGASASSGGSTGSPSMQGRPSGPRPPAGAAPRRGKRTYTRKKKVCRFCVEKIDFIDYKKTDILQSFIRDRGKILPRRITGTCARHQRWVTVAIKRARNIALLPFATEV